MSNDCEDEKPFITRDAPSRLPYISAGFLFFHQRVRVFHTFVCDPKRCIQVRAIGSGRTTMVSIMEDHADEFSSFNMLASRCFSVWVYMAGVVAGSSVCELATPGRVQTGTGIT